MDLYHSLDWWEIPYYLGRALGSWSVVLCRWDRPEDGPACLFLAEVYCQAVALELDHLGVLLEVVHDNFDLCHQNLDEVEREDLQTSSVGALGDRNHLADALLLFVQNRHGDDSHCGNLKGHLAHHVDEQVWCLPTLDRIENAQSLVLEVGHGFCLVQPLLERKQRLSEQVCYPWVA